MPDRLVFIPLRLPLVEEGDDLVGLILEAVEREGEEIENGDVLVVTSKVISKARGYLARVEDYEPSLRSRLVSLLSGRDAREIEMIRRHSVRLLYWLKAEEIEEMVGREDLRLIGVRRGIAVEMLREARAIIAAEHPKAGALSDAGIDWSNCPEGVVCLFPEDPDAEAEELRREIKERTGREVGVVVTDTTALFPRRKCTTDLAVGVSGIPCMYIGMGAPDLYGRPKFGGLDCVADALAMGASLLMRQAGEGIPAVLVKGFRPGPYAGYAPMSRIIVRGRMSTTWVVKAAVRRLILRLLGV